MAAARAYSQYWWCGTIGIPIMSGLKPKVSPQNMRAKAMPNAIPTIIMAVLVALMSPTWWLPSIISSTKLISGTPGTMKSAHAKSGCRGVVVQPGKKVVSQAANVETNAAMAMDIYRFTPALSR